MTNHLIEVLKAQPDEMILGHFHRSLRVLADRTFADLALHEMRKQVPGYTMDDLLEGNRRNLEVLEKVIWERNVNCLATDGVTY